MTLIFLHVPKAGGNSLLDFFRPHYEADFYFDVNQGLNYPLRLQELADLPETQKRSLQLVSGHLPYGIHECLPQDCRYFTVLRDPIDRVVSHYSFVLEQPSHPLHDEIVSRKLNLIEYATSGLSGELNNGMTRLICGRANSDSLRGHEPCCPQDIDLAIEHLQEHFDVVGLLEFIEPTFRVLSHMYGWPMKKPANRNKTKKRISTKRLSDAERHAILSQNAMDEKLYLWASNRFQIQCKELGIALPRPALARGWISKLLPGWS